MNGRRRHREFLDLGAARLGGPLSAADDQRLEAHLAACAACSAWIAGYQADRAALQGLRHLPPPPRELWARTAAALDREQARRASWRGALGRTAGKRPARAALVGALSFLLVVAVAASGLIPGISFFPPQLGAPAATPYPVVPQFVAYVSSQGGAASVYMGTVDRVCPESASTNCLPLDNEVKKVASFGTGFVPQQFSVSPDGSTAAVVGTSSGGGAIYALALPEQFGRTPQPTPSGGATQSAPASASPGTEATPTPPVEVATESPVPASAAPTASGSSEPGATPSEEPSPMATASGPGESPGPSLAVPRAIIQDVTVVGESPSYSRNGTMLAFSAMPADGTTGPDIYLWRVGSDAAVALTTDHDSIFASWAGHLIVGSRAQAADSATGSASPVSFLLDPKTGATRDLARAAWRPIVDPTGRFVIYWDGVLSSAGGTWQEEQGGLYLARWELFDPSAAPTPATSASPPPATTARPVSSQGSTSTPASSPERGVSPSGTAEPNATVEPTPEATIGPEQFVAPRDYARDPILSWEARWSPDGQWFGVWIGDRRSGEPASTPETGRLTVAAVDVARGLMNRALVELDGVPAIRGFALGDHRIAWATVPGPDGTSEVRLLVWTGTSRGLIRTLPGGGTALPAL